MLEPTLVLALLILTSALFSGSEAALFCLNTLQTRQLALRKDRPSRTITRLLRSPQKLLNALLVGNTLANTGLAAAATALALARYGERGLEIAVPAVAGTVLLLGEILPKTIAVKYPVATSRSSALLLAVLLPILSPLTWVVSLLSRKMLRLIGISATGGLGTRRVTHTEVRAAFEEIDDETGMSKFENRLVQNILAFADTTAEEVMTPRVDVTAAPAGATRETLWKIIASAKHSRIPLYRETLDDIVGYLPSRAFLLDPSARIENLIRPVLFVPEKAPVNRIFHDVRKGRRRLVVVVNEYGETVGLITQEDLIEEIVGELYDEYDRSVEEIERLEDGSFLAAGRVSLQDLGERIGVDLPQEHAVTLNGLLCAIHGGFPRPGTRLRHGEIEFVVLEVARHRIARVQIRLPAGEEEEGQR